MHSFYHNAQFILSAPNIDGAPDDSGTEVIFAGCSNVGKSSCINSLTGQKKLARVSKTPGRTQHLVFFKLDDNTRLVDLPGYGYAKVPINVKNNWHANIEKYFATRKSLKGAIILIDPRHLLKKFDELMINWCIENNIEAHILLTKADKLTKNAINKALFFMQQYTENSNITIQTFSSLNKQGIKQLHNKLNKMLNYEVIK